MDFTTNSPLSKRISLIINGKIKVIIISRAWVKIRLTLEEYKKISDLIEEMKRRGEFEAVYIFAKMKVVQAFIYTALQRPLGPEDRFVKGYETYLDYAFNSTRREEALIKFNEIFQDGDLMEDLKKTNNEYQELLEKYSGETKNKLLVFFFFF